jgi:hypothetical protein
VGASNAVEKYSDEDPTFTSSRECKFVTALIKHMDAQDTQGFADEWYTLIMESNFLALNLIKSFP